jgi:hypothetical protein
MSTSLIQQKNLAHFAVLVEVNAHEHDGYYSSNIPCEIGMSEATGKEYNPIVYSVERASRI